MLSKRTKIIATLGPASNQPEVLSSMIDEGVNVIRLNASHYREANDIRKDVAMIRKVADEKDVILGMFLDLQGPKIRIGSFKDGQKITLEQGDTFILTADDTFQGTQEKVSVTYPELIKDLQVGHHLFVDDGNVRLDVVAKSDMEATCTVAVGGVISDHKGMNLPVTKLSLPALTPKDLEDAEVGVECSIDFLAMSFVSNADEVNGLRQFLADRDASHIHIISKIERSTAVDAIDDIVLASDVVMVARGDLGVEIGIEKVPEVQKLIIRTANRHIRPVIVATHMLESMITKKVATRAEVSDVANAIYDRCDAVMLSGETAVGVDPANAIAVMRRICEATDAHKAEIKHMRYSQVRRVFEMTSQATSFCKAADQICDENDADMMIAFTSSGNTALIASKLNPVVPIIASSDDDHVCRRLSMYRGVIPLKLPKPFSKIPGWSEMIDLAVDDAKRRELLKTGDLVVITAGYPIGRPGGTNSIRMMEVS
ncbi:pyruvate kinase [bacterium]|jgi:pyruvate kinase|nr:pyruvate kinase [bacterium]